jgi:hypothetical protein
MAARALRRNLVAFSEKMDKEPGWETEYRFEDIIFSAWKLSGM